MLRTNLSTRPFYNERAVHAALALAAVLVLALTAYNVLRIISLSRHNTELSSQVNREHDEAGRLVQQAAEIRRTVNKDELASVVAAASEANALIDQRTFSWTAFFNSIESTLPDDVMLTSVRPSIRDQQTRVTMMVLGRRAEDIDEFMEQLEESGAFHDVLAKKQDMNEEGLYQANLEAVYTGPEAAAPAAGTPPAPPAGSGATPGAQPVRPGGTPGDDQAVPSIQGGGQ